MTGHTRVLAGPLTRNTPSRKPSSGTAASSTERASWSPPSSELVGTELGDAELTGTELVDAELTGTELVDAELTGTELGGTELVDAELTGTELGGTELVDAELTGTELGGTVARLLGDISAVPGPARALVKPSSAASVTTVAVVVAAAETGPLGGTRPSPRLDSVTEQLPRTIPTTIIAVSRRKCCTSQVCRFCAALPTRRACRTPGNRDEIGAVNGTPAALHASGTTVRSVDDTGAAPFADFAIGEFADLVTMGRELGRTGNWVVRTPFGLFVHGYDQARSILRNPAWISMLSGVAMLDSRDATSLDFTSFMTRALQDAPASSAQDATQDVLRARPNVLSAEGDDHRRLRRLFGKAFTPAAADRLRPFMSEHARQLLDPLVAVGGGEIVSGFCDPYPVPIICRLLGVVDNDWAQFARWAEAIFAVFDGDAEAVMARLGDIARAQAELSAYVDDLISERRRVPASDLLTELIEVSDGGDRLGEDELIGMVQGLLIAGTDTTRNQLGATLAVLADRPDRYAALRADPEQIPAYVEESLRYIGAVRTTMRIATDDVVMDGLLFPAGTVVMIGLHAASLSGSCPARSAASGADGPPPGDGEFDQYEFHPEVPREHPHLGFGSGAHHCLGAFLARAELQEALRIFVERVETFELSEPVQWKPLSMGIWGPSQMHLRLNAPTLPVRTEAGTLPPAPDHVNVGMSEERDRFLSETAPLRRVIRDSVPELIARPRVPPLGRLAVTAARIGWAVYAGKLLDRRLDHEQRRQRIYRRLRLAAAKLGPAYIKLAQLIAAGEGVFPDALVDECRRCRDQAPPEPWSAIREIVEADLGPLDGRFSHFGTEATAAASIAQVHEARLADGTHVMVKVQRPRIRSRVERDLAVLAWIAPKLVGRIPITALANPPALVELFAETISEELDFRVEVANLLEVDQALRATASGRWQVPDPHLDGVTERVIVMSPVAGRPLSALGPDDLSEGDAAAIFRQMNDALLVGACMSGVFHGDFHAGNVFIDTEGTPPGQPPVIGLVDFGITGRLEGAKRVAFLRYVVGLLTGDLQSQVSGMIDLGAFGPRSSPEQVIADLRLDRPGFDPLELTEDEFTAEFRALISGLLANGARIPKELMLFVKNFAYLCSATSELAPDMDVLAQFERIASSFFARNGVRMATEIGFSPAPDDVNRKVIRQAMGISPRHERVTWRLIRGRRTHLKERVGKKG
ncbi:cytochrome P450 [Candidatus Poriferisodalis sp.]|uniref:cytochrome P450 n=1 Tax=Candidatus Poriferisodalis sp. TaxID=3101277 RepID=UPI003B01B7A1